MAPRRDPDPAAYFREALRHYRQKAGLSGRALGIQSGLGERVVRGLEAGRTTPRLSHVMALAVALGVAPDAFLAERRVVKPFVLRERSVEAIDVQLSLLEGELGKRNASLLRMRFVWGHTRREIGGAMGISAERARQIEVEALAKFPDLRPTATDKDDSLSHFAVVLRKVRKQKRLSYPALARVSGLAEGTLWELEKSQRSPTLATLCRLADALEVPRRTFVEEQA